MSWVAKKALRPTAIIIGVLALAVIAGALLRNYVHSFRFRKDDLSDFG